MKDSIALYCRFINISIQSQMQYKLSFFLQSLGQFMVNGAEFVGIYSLFISFGNIRGWILPEVAVFYGLAAISFSISQSLTTGFSNMGHFIKSGELDRILLRPRTTELQLFGFELSLKKTGRLIQGLIVLIYGFTHLSISWSLGRILVIFWTLMGSSFLFVGLMMIQAAISFWTIESLEIMNTLTYGGQETCRYPMNIYMSGFRQFFTYVIPLACINYYPALYIMGKEDPLGSSPLFQMLSPAAGFIFFCAALIFWRFGIRFYKSTGS